MKKSIIALLALTILSTPLSAQKKWAVETNIIDWCNYGTLNVEASRSLNRYSTVTAGVRFNSWTFKFGDTVSKNAARSASVGVRFWPWHIYSGWWFAAKAQMEEYARGMVFNLKEYREGYAYGASFSLGYALMLGPQWNLNFGLGGWLGYERYSRYSCPGCGIKRGEKSGFFALPNNETKIAVMYVF